MCIRDSTNINFFIWYCSTNFKQRHSTSNIPKGITCLNYSFNFNCLLFIFQKTLEKRKKFTKAFFSYNFKLYYFYSHIKNFRFFSSNFSVVSFCILLLGWKKNLLFITSKYNFSACCFYFFWNDFRIKISSRNYNKPILLLAWIIFY